MFATTATAIVKLKTKLKKSRSIVISSKHEMCSSSLSSSSSSSSSSWHCTLVTAADAAAAVSSVVATVAIKTRVPLHQLACPVYPYLIASVWGKTRTYGVWRAAQDSKHPTRAVIGHKSHIITIYVHTIITGIKYTGTYKFQNSENWQMDLLFWGRCTDIEECAVCRVQNLRTLPPAPHR